MTFFCVILARFKFECCLFESTQEEGTIHNQKPKPIVMEGLLGQRTGRTARCFLKGLETWKSNLVIKPFYRDYPKTSSIICGHWYRENCISLNYNINKRWLSSWFFVEAELNELDKMIWKNFSFSTFSRIQVSRCIIFHKKRKLYCLVLANSEGIWRVG